MFTFLPGPFLVQFSGPFYLSTDTIRREFANIITYGRITILKSADKLFWIEVQEILNELFALKL